MKLINQKFLLLGLTLLFFVPQGFSADLGKKSVLTLEVARSVALAAEKKAIENHWLMTIAVMDDGGNLLFLERMDDAQLGTIEIAQKKAHTSVFFKSPTKDFRDGLAKGLTSLLKIDALPFEGGIPIVLDGKVIGAIGVSGGALDTQDGQVAQAGVNWFTNNISSSK